MSVFESLSKGLNEAIQIKGNKLSARKNKLTVNSVKEFTNIEIKNIRENLKVTQIIFAQILGVSKKTVEAWEAGINNPNGSAKRIIGLLKEDPDFAEKHHIISH